MLRDRKGTPKNLCDKDFAELSGELSGAICLKTLVLLGSALELFTDSLFDIEIQRKTLKTCTKLTQRCA